MFHLQTVFNEEATERQQIYISNHLKKPQCIMVRAYFTRVEQLNNYIKYLPSIYNSPKATESTQLAVPYTEAQLAVQLLRMCLVHWQNQYDLNQNTIPQDTRRLLAVLENIEKLSTSSTVPKSPSNGNTGGNSKSNGNSEKGGKRKSGILTPTRFRRRLALRNIATCARNMGVCLVHTILACVPSMRKMVPSRPSGARKPHRRPPVRLKQSAGMLSRRWPNGWPNLRRRLRSVPRLFLIRRSATTKAVVIPTLNRKLG
jgi:hypothetical protein